MAPARKTSTDERRRRDQLAVGVGILLAVLGLVGVVVGVATGHASSAAGSVLFLVVGVVTLVAGLRALPRDSQDPGAGKPPDVGGPSR